MQLTKFNTFGVQPQLTIDGLYKVRTSATITVHHPTGKAPKITHSLLAHQKVDHPPGNKVPIKIIDAYLVRNQRKDQNSYGGVCGRKSEEGRENVSPTMTVANVIHS